MAESLWNINSVVLKASPRDRLAGITCSIGPGITAILGGSGAGKTSLLHLLAGLESPDGGTIERQPGNDSDRLPLYWAPQDGGLWPHLTVRQHLTEIGKDADSADKLLAEFDLTERSATFPVHLSQGERSRLAIARALAVNAGVLLFDEPLVHVDGKRKATGWQFIRNHLDQTGTHLVLTTHEPDVVLREADAVICLADGKLSWNGDVQDLYYNPPDEVTGRILGPLNWFTPQDQQRWLSPHDRRDAPVCVRPEQLQLVPASNAQCVVAGSRFCGHQAETELRLTETDERRTVVHRPASALEDGTVVALNVVAHSDERHA